MTNTEPMENNEDKINTGPWHQWKERRSNEKNKQSIKTGIRKFWDELPEIDRESVMEALDIKNGFGKHDFLDLPNHIRTFLYSVQGRFINNNKELEL